MSKRIIRTEHAPVAYAFHHPLRLDPGILQNELLGPRVERHLPGKFVAAGSGLLLVLLTVVLRHTRHPV